jgi:hypothetical protein
LSPAGGVSVECAALGYVRLTISAVTSVKFERHRMRGRDVLCRFCTSSSPSSRDGSHATACAAAPRWTTRAVAMVRVEDGTTTGVIACRSFRVVSEILRASTAQCDVIRACVAEYGKLSVCGNETGGVAAEERYQRRFTSQVDKARAVVCQLAERACRPVVAVLRPVVEVEGSQDGQWPDVTMNGSVYVGYGRKVLTAVAGGLHEAKAECVGVVEEAWWEGGTGGVCAAELVGRMQKGSLAGDETDGDMVT